jgi:hypothetical protein
MAVAKPASGSPARARHPHEEETLAKGQKKSNREIRKPKADKPKPATAGGSFVAPGSKKK